MKNTKLNPSQKLYKFFDTAYSHFNEKLFNGELSDIIITLQRQPRTMGYFSPNRWQDSNKNNTHEIALNPQYFASFPLIELFQTLVHEQCHLWQHEHGKPSRSGYHNKQWAKKMESIGLIPSSTGTVGGKKVGQHMADYAIQDGSFIKESILLDKSGVLLPFFDRNSNPATINEDEQTTLIMQLLGSGSPLSQVASISSQTSTSKPQTRAKYTCPKCKVNVWGKNNININCVDCDMKLIKT